MARQPWDPYYTESIPTKQKKAQTEWSWDEFLGGLAQGIPSGMAAGINLKELGDKESTRRLAELRKDPDFYLDKYDRLTRPDTTELTYAEPSRPSITPEQVPGSLWSVPDVPSPSQYGIPEPTTPEHMGRQFTPEIDLLAVREARDRALAKKRLVQSPANQKFLENMTEGDALILRAERESKERGLVANDVKINAEDYAKSDAALTVLREQRTILDAKAKAAYDRGDVDTAVSFKNQAEQLTKAATEINIKMSVARKNLEELGLSREEYDTVLQPGKRSEAIQDLIRKAARTGRVRRPGTK